ncbi:MAG: aldehyde dehydrogenase [Endozoicomonadaceae bacterium]|nr:aldehyde dehydrogenase [Endozoicomonadaceae bacterium]
MIYTPPGDQDAIISFKPRYENFIGGEWISPRAGHYFNDLTPITGEPICEVPRSSAEDVELALDHAHQAFPNWSATSVTERSGILLKIADRIEQNLEYLAVAESWENGKPIRESLAADLPLMVDHFRYFAGCIRAQEGSLSDIDAHMVSYHFREPVGVVGQIIPWNFPLLMAAWKLAPALAAGCCSVLKPAEQTPVTILLLMELIGDLIPPGVVNIVNGYGDEAGQALASSSRINKLAFTGSTPVGSKILRCAADNIIPCTVELGGKSPNIFFPDVMKQDNDFINKAVEGMLMTFLNQGEVCTCPSRALIHESIFDELMSLAISRAQKIRQGNPLNTDTMIGAQVSKEQFDKVLNYMQVAHDEGASFLLGGEHAVMPSPMNSGYYIQPTILKGENRMRVFQEEIFGPTLAVTTFRDEKEAIAIANDSIYGLGAGVWTLDINRAQRMGRAIQAGRIWINCYHAYPAHSAFGGFKKSGVGREGHCSTLDHYQQTKNILTSYSTSPLGFF